MNTRTRKSLRDLNLNRSRTALLIASVAVGVAASGGVLGSFNVIDREIGANYASTNPADAVLTIAGDARDWIEEAKEVPGVQVAEPRLEVLARLDDEPGWQRLTLVVINDFSAIAAGGVFLEGEAVAPGAGEMLVERASLTEVDLAVGDAVMVSLPGQAAEEVRLSGLAHDPGRTPAWMFGNVVAYITPDTLALLGPPAELHTLLILTDGEQSQQANREIAEATAAHLTAAGATVTAITVPNPGEHPASGVMRTLLFLLQGFGVITLVASVSLVVTLIATQMTQQRREIALMKTSGATSMQIGGIYIVSALVVSAAGLILGIPLGLLLTRGLSSFALTLLNLNASSFTPAAWVILVQICVALVVPVIAIIVPVWRRSRVPVRSGLSDAVRPRMMRARATRTASWMGRATDIGLRNAARERSRLGLNALALGVGAAAFVAALNTGAAWDAAVDREFNSQHYDVEVLLTEPVAATAVDDATHDVPGIDSTELWVSSRANATVVNAPDAPPGTPFLLYVPPVDAASVSYPLLEGRWLEPGDTYTLVVSQNLDDPTLHVGDHVRLDGDSHTWTVVGRVVQLAGDREGVAYASTLPSFVPGPDLVNAVRITGPSIGEALDAADAAFSSADIPVAAIVSADDARESLDDHLFIITGLLLAMAALLGIVGTLGLVESIGTAALERRREIGVAQAVGASSRQTMQMVMSEAMAITAIAWAAGALMSWPVTASMQASVGTIFTGAPLPFTIFTPGLAISLFAMIAVAAITSAVPGLEAADRPVREALAHE
jgi:putative ABC transport system permease protein